MRSCRTKGRVVLAEKINEAYEKLREYVYRNELERREWAHERWGHVGGRVFKIMKVLMPVMSVVSILFAVFYEMIRDAQTFLSKTGGLSYEAAESTFDLYIVIVYCVLIVTVNVLPFAKRSLRLFSEIACSAVTAFFCVYLLTQMNIAMPNGQYKTMLWIVIGVGAALIAVCLVAAVIEIADKRSLKQSFENTLSRLTAESGELTDESEYPALIEEFLAKQEKITPEKREKKFRKQAK